MPSSNNHTASVSLFGGYLCVIAAAVCWGASGIWVKFIEQASAPSAPALAFWRDSITFLVLLTCALVVCPQKLKIKRSAWPKLIGMGASLGAFHIFYNLGIMLNGVGITTVQQAAMPAFVTIAARFLWQESLSGAKLAALALTFSGTLLTTDLIFGGSSQDFTYWGLAAGLCTPMLYASLSLFGKHIGKEYDAIVLLTYAFGIASLLLLPIQPFVVQPSQIDLTGLLYFSGLILISTVGGFMLFINGLNRVPASNASIIAMSEIAFALVFAYVFLAEVMDWMQAAGGSLVIVGVLLIIKPTSRGSW
jgi:DME family drug/metabolite transporter